jgi:hypothetical protein
MMCTEKNKTFTTYDPFVNAYLYRNETGADGFLFEEDFVEEGLRCIPMLVRFKMDIAGIKLKLSEWSQFTVSDRLQLTKRSCMTDAEITGYRFFLERLIKTRTGNEATVLAVDPNPSWSECDFVPEELQAKAEEFQWHISLEQWKQLSNLQRFTLVKLCRPGHENRNFPIAVQEFGLDIIPYL